MRNSCIAGLLFGPVLACFIGAWLVRAVSRPLEEAVQIASGINQAISQMDQVTQQNAALVEQAAAASEALQEQANNLAQIVGVFKLSDTAGSASLPFVKTEPSRLDQSGAATHRPALGRSTRPLSIASR